MNPTSIFSNIIFFFALASTYLVSQTLDSLNFFPAHAGDVRQYRSQFTGEVTRTHFFDKDSTDQYKTLFIWYRDNFGGTGVYKIDSAGNVYELYAVNDTNKRLLYKLNADTGSVWTYIRNSSTDSIVAKIVEISSGSIFGKQVIVKKIEYMRHRSGTPFWLGDRYLSSGFGMIKWNIEPSDVYYLSGAIINGIKYGTVVSVKKELTLPEAFETLNNYPNPFNPSTTVEFTLASNAEVRVVIYNALGQQVAVLLEGFKYSGDYRIRWDANTLPAGLYFCRLESDNRMQIVKMVLMK